MEGSQPHSRVRKPSPEPAEVRRLVMRFADMLPAYGDVLEVSDGPGSLAIPLARTGRMHVTVLYTNAAARNAALLAAESAGVRMDVHKGNPARMPFPDGCFDFIFCRAPLKGFSDPVAVLREMRRVLKPGRRGVILNLRRDVPRPAMMRHVESLHSSATSRISAFLKLRLQQRRTFTLRQFEALLSQVPFGSTRVDGTLIGVEAWFER